MFVMRNASIKWIKSMQKSTMPEAFMDRIFRVDGCKGNARPSIYNYMHQLHFKIFWCFKIHQIIMDIAHNPNFQQMFQSCIHSVITFHFSKANNLHVLWSYLRIYLNKTYSSGKIASICMVDEFSTKNMFLDLM